MALIVTKATQSESDDSNVYRSSVLKIMVKYSENAEFLSVLVYLHVVASINHPKGHLDQTEILEISFDPCICGAPGPQPLCNEQESELNLNLCSQTLGWCWCHRSATAPFPWVSVDFARVCLLLKIYILSTYLMNYECFWENNGKKGNLTWQVLFWGCMYLCRLDYLKLD